MLEITRFTERPVEGLTVQRDGGGRKLRGVASVYYDGTPSTEYELAAGVVERIAPGAFDHLLRGDCIACFNHDPNAIVGRTPDTLRLWTTARGLEYEVDLPNTTAANDLWENVQKGIIRGSSFRAMLNTADKASIEWRRDGDRDVMVIRRFDQLRDVSPVVEPAYFGTDVTAIRRSLDQHHARLATDARIAAWKSINK